MNFLLFNVLFVLYVFFSATPNLGRELLNILSDQTTFAAVAMHLLDYDCFLNFKVTHTYWYNARGN